MVKTQAYVSAISALLPRGFDQTGAKDGPGSNTLPAYDGAGGLVSTANDIMTWLQFNIGILAIPELAGVLTPMQTPNTVPGTSTTPGLGWFVSDLPGSSPKRTIVQKKAIWMGFAARRPSSRREGCSTSSAGEFAMVNYRDTAPNAPSSPATDIEYQLLLAMTSPQVGRLLK
jgi:CubicO group peptidase (beta-lactamase class C family)